MLISKHYTATKTEMAQWFFDQFLRAFKVNDLAPANAVTLVRQSITFPLKQIGITQIISHIKAENEKI